MSAEDDVRAASDRFYRAYNELMHGRALGVSEAWLQDESVTCAHAFGEWLEGWSAIWQRVLADAAILTRGSVRIVERTIHVFDDVAYTCGIEHCSAHYGSRHHTYVSQATMIMRKVGEQWLLVHQHVNNAPSKRL
jgi:hypothetical protein